MPAFAAVCAGLFLSVLDFTCLALLLSSHSLGRMGSSILALDMAQFGFLLSLHKFGHLDLLALVFGESSPEASLPALDFLHPGLLSLVRSFAYLGPSASTSRVLRISSFLSLRSLVCSELTLSLSDMLRMDLMMLALDTVKLELSLLSQQILCFEPTLFAFGISQTGPFLLVLDVALLDSLLLSQDHLLLGSGSFPLQHGSSGSTSVSFRSFNHSICTAVEKFQLHGFDIFHLRCVQGRFFTIIPGPRLVGAATAFTTSLPFWFHHVYCRSCIL